MASLNSMSFIVIGAGFGGLACAISLAKLGHAVKVFELSKDLKRQGTSQIFSLPCFEGVISEINNSLGDVIMVGSNATRIIASWDTKLMDEIWKMSAQPEALRIQDKHGKVLLNQPLPKMYDGFPNIYTNRTRLQNMLYDHAVSLGVDFNFGVRVTDYFEDDDSAGISINGIKHTADAVLVADGVHSKGRHFVTGVQDKALKSGFAVYRSWFPLDRLNDHELTKGIAQSNQDQFAIWIAEDIHAILTTNVKLGTCTCFATHKVTIRPF